MKKLLVLSILMLFFSVLFISCDPNVHTTCPTNPKDTLLPEVQVQLGDFKSKVATTTYTKDSFKEKTGLGLTVGILLATQSVDHITVDALTYVSENASGERIIASGIITYPTTHTIKGIIVAQHYTITANREAPSKSMYVLEQILAFKGYAVIHADYIGFGSSVNQPQPYMHAQTTGLDIANMVRASKIYMGSISRPIDTLQAYAIGYSQGAVATLAFQRYVEENNPQLINLQSSLVGGGPYDLESTMDYIIDVDTIGIPASVPCLILGLNTGDNLELPISSIFKEPLLSNYQNWILSKNFTLDEICAHLNSNTCISDMINVSMLQSSTVFRQSLENNSLINWTPRAAIELYHSETDGTVPYLNAQNAYDAFTARGCTVELHTLLGDHHVSAAGFYMALAAKL